LGELERGLKEACSDIYREDWVRQQVFHTVAAKGVEHVAQVDVPGVPALPDEPPDPEDGDDVDVATSNVVPFGRPGNGVAGEPTCFHGKPASDCDVDGCDPRDAYQQHSCPHGIVVSMTECPQCDAEGV